MVVMLAVVVYVWVASEDLHGCHRKTMMVQVMTTQVLLTRYAHTHALNLLVLYLLIMFIFLGANNADTNSVCSADSTVKQV